MPQKKLQTIMKAFVSSHFAYCPLLWMFNSRQINHKINKLHERTLRIVYNDHFLSFEELLSKYKSVTVPQQNLQILATELYPEILCKTFLKLKVTTTILVIRQDFSQEILKQLENDYRPSVAWLQIFGTFYLKR